MTSNADRGDKTSVSVLTNSSDSEELRGKNESNANVPSQGAGSGNVGEVSQSCCAKSIPHNDAVHLNTFLQRQSKRVARNPCTYMCTSIFIALAMSYIGLRVGNFVVEVENEGWWSRGTLHSDRQRQGNLVRNNRFNFAYNQSAWEIWTDPDIDHPSYEELFYSPPIVPKIDTVLDVEWVDPSDEYFRSRNLGSMRDLLEKAIQKDEERRKLEQDAPVMVLAGCDLDFYNNPSQANLWPIWRIPDEEYEATESRTILDPDVLEAICLAETNTQNYLEENSLCDAERRGCNSGKCIPPYSPVLYARLIIQGALDLSPDGGYVMDCKGLAAAWTSDYQERVTESWIQDIKDIKVLMTPGASKGKKEKPEFPYGYYPALVQSDFDTNGGQSQYTSSIFDTAGIADGQELLDVVDNLDRADASGGIVLGAYDTGYEAMGEVFTDSLVASDMTLALASAVVIAIAIMLHTQSPLITGLGLLQIVLSFPLGYFCYALVLGYSYFPFLNFIGVFVVFALGAGDIFVAFDKWTNCRKNNVTKSTEYVAALALPESLGAMFLTTLTTALAFFATAVCPVAPIKMFAIFCGLLIIFDYVLTVCFVFPGLCIYDQALINRAAGKKAWYTRVWFGCVGCGTCCRFCSKTVVYDDVVVTAHSSNPPKEGDLELSVVGKEDSSDDSENYNGTQRCMVTLAQHLRRLRWPLLAFCIVTMAVSCYYALKLTLPDSSEVRLIKPSIQYEQSYQWRKELLSTSLGDLAGSEQEIVFGLEPGDTGKQTDPYDGTSLILDETFDPTSTEAQLYLRDFCTNLYEEDFAMIPSGKYVCAMNKLDKWLKDQSLAVNPDPLYTAICGSPNGLPIDSNKFHACVSAWSLSAQVFEILSWDGIVKYIRIEFRSSVIFTDQYDILQEDWDAINNYLTAVNEDAPEGVNKSFFTSITFHWHDTNGSIFKTAYSAAGIALAASAAIILFSSHSVVLTIFSTVTILFILLSVTAILVGLGWNLGFLESICFSILIGVSVDFVIHFNHAYVHHKGEIPREERTRYAMVTMGPSILATAGTTFFSAIVMLFCTITFFNKFALVLFFTIVMATIASFVVFITLTNCFGPTNPTYMVDKCLSICGFKVVAMNESSNGSSDSYLTAQKVKSLDE